MPQVASGQQSKIANFKKIAFHVSPSCYLNICSDFHLELNRNKQVRWIAQQQRSQKHEDIYAVGLAADSSFGELLFQLKTIVLDSLFLPDSVFATHRSFMTIIIYPIGKQKVLKMGLVSEKGEVLIEALQEICNSNLLNRTKRKPRIKIKA
jgi:hypothetical protein